MSDENPDDRLDAEDRFAFIPRRIHAFRTTGNAYDATQVDEAIKTGDTLLILGEAVVGIAHTWPFAVTSAHGKLHSIKPAGDRNLDEPAAGLGVCAEDFINAAALAVALGFELDLAVAALLRGAHASQGPAA